MDTSSGNLGLNNRNNRGQSGGPRFFNPIRKNSGLQYRLPVPEPQHKFVMLGPDQLHSCKGLDRVEGFVGCLCRRIHYDFSTIQAAKLGVNDRLASCIATLFL